MLRKAIQWMLCLKQQEPPEESVQLKPPAIEANPSEALLEPDAEGGASPVVSGLQETSSAIPTNLEVAAIAMREAREARELQGFLPEGVQEGLDKINSIEAVVSSASDLIGPLLGKVENFANLLDKLGDIHPYAKFATSILVGAVNVVKEQYERDKAMGNLLQMMDGVYRFACRAETLKDIDPYRKMLLKKMSVQTIHCAYFIRDHSKLKSFVRRMVVNIGSGDQIDGAINDFTESFRNICAHLTQHGVLEGELRLVNLSVISTELQTEIGLQTLICMQAPGENALKGCLPGTRRVTMDRIFDWANAMDSPRVLFLLGGAGTGKSSIAHSIGVQFRDLERLGSFVRFDRNSQSDRPLQNVIRTIARDLADCYPAFRNVLAQAVHDKRDLDKTVNMARQWDELIIAPLKKVELIGPLLLIIDAFDECAPVDAQERCLLLNLLTESSSKLPDKLRILITSRPELDVLRVLGSDNLTHVEQMDLDLEEYTKEARSDIVHYVRHQLAREPGAGLLDEDMQKLANKAEGLFQWAATACRRILESYYGMTLQERIDLMLQAGSTLDELYRGILEGLFSASLARETVMERFRLVMAQILCSSSPLSLECLEEIRGIVTGVAGEVGLIVNAMGSLLSGVHTPGSTIRPHHTSFRDFLLDAERSLAWFVTLDKGHAVMARGCVGVMNKRLAFNMCGLEDSRRLNRDIPGLDARIATSIPQSLSYAACNWQDHLPRTDLGSDLQQELDEFLQEKLLFWLEVLSLLGTLNRAAPSLEAALKVYQESGSCKKLLQDAISFIRHSAGAIALSAAHAYVSALPFSPTSSLVRTIYLSRFSSLPVVQGVDDHWPQTRAVLSGHTNLVYAVAYSSDGRRIASGSLDHTVRIWDVETCATIHTLKCDSIVYSVAFSPDGHHIAAACADHRVRVWNSASGDLVCELSHESRVICVAYASDGKCMASGDDDGNVCVWSTETYSKVGQLAHGALVCTIAFSPNGQYLASGGEDNNVRVWDVNDGRLVGIEEHTDWVRSVLFSRDGQWIISGSEDATIRIWDRDTQRTLHTIAHPLLSRIFSLSLSPDGRRVVSGSTNECILVWDTETRQLAGGPFVGHSECVTSVSFSPDGRHIVSGSDDLTVRIWSAEDNAMTGSKDVPPQTSSVTSVAWSPDGSCVLSGNEDGSVNVWDANTGESILAHLTGHSKWVRCIKFSPNGSRFVTASDDRTLRVWDSATLQSLGEPLHGHTISVRGVDFSPDGRRIVSCSHDRTLRIWDTETHEPLLEPLIGHDSFVACIAWSPNGKYIASGSADRTMRVWDAETGGAIGEPFKGHSRSIRSVSWSIDAQFVMTSSEDGTIRFWDVQNGAPAGKPIYCNQGEVFCARYSLDGGRIVSAGRDGTLRMWDVQTRKPIGMPLIHPLKSRCYELSFSPDGRFIITRMNDFVVVWDANAFIETPRAYPTTEVFKFVMSSERVERPPTHWDGWVRDAKGDLVIWVPDEYRHRVSWRGIVRILGRKPITIDLANSSYGLYWPKYIDSLNPP